MNSPKLVDPVNLFNEGGLSLLSDVHIFNRLAVLEKQNETLKEIIRRQAERLRRFESEEEEALKDILEDE
jgi:hypothetical protein